MAALELGPPGPPSCSSLSASGSGASQEDEAFGDAQGRMPAFKEVDLEVEFALAQLLRTSAARQAGATLMLLLVGVHASHVIAVGVHLQNSLSSTVYVVALLSCLAQLGLLGFILAMESRPELYTASALRMCAYEFSLVAATVASAVLLCLSNYRRAAGLAGLEPTEAWGEEGLLSDSHLLLLLCTGMVVSQSMLPRVRRAWVTVPCIVCAFVAVTAAGGTEESPPLHVLNSLLLFCIGCVMVLMRRSAERLERRSFYELRRARLELSLLERSLRGFADATFELSGSPPVTVCSDEGDHLCNLFGRPMVGEPLTSALDENEDSQRLIGFLSEVWLSEELQKISLVFKDAHGAPFVADILAFYVHKTPCQNGRIIASLAVQGLPTSSGGSERDGDDNSPKTPGLSGRLEEILAAASQAGAGSGALSPTRGLADTMSCSSGGSSAGPSDTTVTIEALSSDLTILRCSREFTALSGPKPVGQSFASWVLERDAFSYWLQDAVNGVLCGQTKTPCAVEYGDLRLLTPTAARLGVAFQVFCGVDFPEPPDDSEENDESSQSYCVTVIIRFVRPTRVLQRHVQRLSRNRGSVTSGSSGNPAPKLAPLTEGMALSSRQLEDSRPPPRIKLEDSPPPPRITARMLGRSRSLPTELRGGGQRT